MSTSKKSAAAISAEEKAESEAVVEEIESETAKPDYTHKFAEPFEWEGMTYETLEFNFGRLRGKDALAISRELSLKGITVLSERLSQDYLVRVASRACGLGVDAFEAMSYRDYAKIIARARNFIPAATLF